MVVRHPGPAAALLEDRDVDLVREPLLVQLGDGAVGLERVEGLVDAGDQRVALANSIPNCSCSPLTGGSWPTIVLPLISAAVR